MITSSGTNNIRYGTIELIPYCTVMFCYNIIVLLLFTKYGDCSIYSTTHWVAKNSHMWVFTDSLLLFIQFVCEFRMSLERILCEGYLEKKEKKVRNNIPMVHISNTSTLRA